MRNESRNILYDMVREFSGGLDRSQVHRIVRLVCRELGGLDVYVPEQIGDTETCRVLLGVFRHVLGDGAEAALSTLLFRAGGLRLYVPKEITAFRADIALEVVHLRESGKASTIELAKRYGVTARTLSVLYNEGTRIRMERATKKLF